ncbi:conjugal transfer protein TraK [Achromobacter xylosoxidans]|uniref:IcmT/TraK family protein n=1 Tax=Alcaligenes xylosoxydans xylosoxydans TaxID=85698 RepID=UPI0008A3D742|nr:IcmT/TraK family protein [Achromobacter xylosoxidans]OFS61691.1 conjugal transfer protein TraK [Achromobacter xylosoxidans]
MKVSIWRDGSRVPEALGISCVAYLPVFIWLFHMRAWTFYLAVSVIVVYAVLAKFGLTTMVLWGKLLHLLRGPRVLARPWWWRNRFDDR